MNFLTATLAIVLALIVGVILGWYFGRLGSATPVGLREENVRLQAELSGAQQARDLLAERVESLEERSRADSDVLQALAPVKMQLAIMEKSVRSMETQRAQQFGSVSEALQSSARTQEQLRDMTASLSTALRSSSARGTWGEAQLRRVVEAAGMLEHVSFSEQVSTVATSAQGKDRAIRPDMVINLPGEKTVVVDSKAPLNAYLDAQDAKDSGQQKAQLARHAKAVRAHVDALGQKKYWDGFAASPELVICFIPAESALSAALHADSSLLDYAAAKNIALVSPVSLLAALKAISFSWRQNALTNNARELFTLSKQLYERLGTAGAHLATMGRMLTRTVDSYNGLIGSLETRVFVTARKIAELDSATLVDNLGTSPVEASVKPLTAPEFVAETPGSESHTDPEDEANDDAATAFARYRSAFTGEQAGENDLREVQVEDHTHPLKSSPEQPAFENIPLWDQYGEGFAAGVDDDFDDPAIITERPYVSTEAQDEAWRQAQAEDPFDYDSWNEDRD